MAAGRRTPGEPLPRPVHERPDERFEFGVGLVQQGRHIRDRVVVDAQRDLARDVVPQAYEAVVRVGAGLFQQGPAVQQSHHPRNGLPR
ncbi:hypothetical protein [Streptomyces sp. NPDC001530]|uniref:hypothetical protein n=1 Tax=Streptomyces sp. NPDC001530 TaxID=3364582 RepID=UPI0036C473F6